MCQPGALRRDSARMVPCSRAGTPPNTISQRKVSQNARGEDLISSSAGAVLFFALRDIRFAVFSFAVPREPGFSSAGPRHPPLLFRTVFHPLVCFPLLGSGPMDRCGLFLFSAFPLFLLCFSALPLFAFRLFVSGCADPERMGANGREWDVGKRVNGRFISAGHRPFLTSPVILLSYARRICRFRYNRRRSRCSVPRRTWCSGNF